MNTAPIASEEMVLTLAKMGVLFGHRKSKTHPKMRPFISGIKNEIVLLDPDAILAGVARAGAFLMEKVSKGGLILFVGTTPSSRPGMKVIAQEFSFPYVVSRWLGGTLTNFKVVHGRLRHYEDLKIKRDQGELTKYTKKEQLGFSVEISKLSKLFDGLSMLTRVPDAIVVVDVASHMAVVREAKLLSIPVIGIVDSNDDPSIISFPIIANDHAKSSIDWVLNELREAIVEGKATQAAVAAKEQ